MTLLIVIVNYRVADLTIDCLRSLRAEVAAQEGTRVVVTDNASGDDSVARLTAAVLENGWGDWVAIHPLDRNGGFAFGNNAAIRPALQGADPPPYVLLLNPDTIVRPGALKTLVEFMEGQPEVGIAGSRLEDAAGTPLQSAFRFPTVLGEFEGGVQFGPISRLLDRWVINPPVPQSAVSIDWVAGACMIVRRQVFDAIGLMDEGYFLYFEEVDFCHRARRAGWTCWYVPSARVVHLVGQSSDVNDPRLRPARKRRPGYWFLARRRYFLSNHGRIATVLADLAWSLGYVSCRARRALLRRPNHDPRLLLWDFFRFNFLLAKK